MISSDSNMHGPRHLAVIPDGNRRCAKRLLKRPWKGHEWGATKVKKVFEWGSKLGVKTITFYALSLENMEKRPKREIDYLFRLAGKEVSDMIENRDNFVHKNQIRVSFFGNLHLLPKDLQDKMDKAMDITRNYRKFAINFAIAYGGRQEITEACRRIATGVQAGKLTPSAIDEMVIKHNLQTNGYGDPDLVIRTGGEKRLSNFLLFQSAYSELAFVDALWPDFSEKEFVQVIKDYQNRDRRFGK
jgi:tritrans,polycis-undecaprenyl-diphosphate synthase [geranylgeranyl-diphosphate specific]